MKKIYSIKKEFIFEKGIYDIVSISLDKKITIDGYAIKGIFKVNGEYLVKENDKEEFNIDIPYLNYIEDDYDISNIKTNVADFYYEVKDNNILVVNIDIDVDGLEEKERCVDYEDEILVDKSFNELNTSTIVENKVDVVKENKIENNDVSDDNVIKEEKIVEEIKQNDYVTYKVSIVRDGDTIESIMEKYNVTLDTLKKYNVINDIKVGDKLVIPYEKN